MHFSIAVYLALGGGGGERYEVTTIHTAPPCPHPFRGPLEGVGPENRAFLGPYFFEGN